MASLFESILYPTSIITSILFAVVGVYWFFLITNTTFSFMAMVGILILMGIVVNNGIVLIDHVNLLRSRGLSRNQAIVQAGTGPDASDFNDCRNDRTWFDSVMSGQYPGGGRWTDVFSDGPCHCRRVNLFNHRHDADSADDLYSFR